MAIKRMFSPINAKHKACLNCDQQIESRLKDNTVYTCPGCGQAHFVDVYERSVALTVAERPDIRRRNSRCVKYAQQKAREALGNKTKAWVQMMEECVKVKELNYDAWVAEHKEWLEELAAMPEEQQAAEYQCMSEDMRFCVAKYLDNRK